MLSYGIRDDVMSNATYTQYHHIDRGSSHGWLANTGSTSTVGSHLATATHKKQTTSPMTLVSPYSQSNLTDYSNLNVPSKT